VVLPETLTFFGWTDSTLRLKVGAGFPSTKERPVAESLLAAWDGRSLAAVVLQFTARCSQHRFIEWHNQPGSPLELYNENGAPNCN
jgi:hypothetical protein